MGVSWSPLIGGDDRMFVLDSAVRVGQAGAVVVARLAVSDAVDPRNGGALR